MKRFAILGAAAALGACVTTAPPAKIVDTTSAIQTAMTICGVHDIMVRKLAEDYREKQQWISILESGLVLEMFVSPSGTWTMVVTNSQGLACLFSSGVGYHPFKSSLPMQLPPQQSPAPATPKQMPGFSI